MTLCLAWDTSKNISVLSDSRLSNGNEIVTDQATKIFRIQVNLKTPYGQNHQKFQPKYYCFCFAGSYLNGSLLANMIEALFNDITIFNKKSEYSFEQLSKIAFGVYKHISKYLSSIHRNNGLSEVLFGGQCYKTNNVKFSIFKTSINEFSELVFKSQKLILKRKPTTFGDKQAKIKFEQLYNDSKPINENFHILKKIIDDKEIKTVGGEIQYGFFKNGNFEYCSLSEYFKKEEGNEDQFTPPTYLFGCTEPLDARLKFRGIDLTELMKEFRPERVNFGIYSHDPFGTAFKVNEKEDEN